MKPEANLVIIERDSERCTLSYDRGHFMNEKEITKLIKRGGFIISKIDKHLPQDNIYIAIMPENKIKSD